MLNNNSQNKIRNMLVIFILAALFVPLLSGCAQKPKVYRVGIVSGLPPFATMTDGFIAAMAELGYIEGENIVYDTHLLDPDPDQIQEVLDGFVADKVDLIFVLPTEAALLAKAATAETDIPVVFAMAGLEGTDLVDSVRQPGSNITGVRYPGPELTVRRFEILNEMTPHLSRLYVSYRQTYPANRIALEELRPVAEASGITLVEVPLASVEDLEADLQARAAADDIGMDAILIMPDDITQSPDGWPLISQFAAEHKIPIGGSAAFEADTGAVFSYINENITTGKLAAPLADKIFKGTPAGTIPVVTPESELRINYKLAQELGLTVSEGLLSQATEIIR